MKFFYNRHKAKMGFTIVELVVVLAIIGIILALVLPSMFSSNKPTKGKEYAKSYFYTVQDFMARQRISNDKTKPSLAVDYIFYTELDASGVVLETGVIQCWAAGNVYAASDNSDAATVAADTAYTDEFKELVNKFDILMKNTTAMEDTEFDGTFYAVVDTDFVVHAAYWTDCDWDTLTASNSNLQYADECIVNGYYSCAYPQELSDVAGVTSRYMFGY